MATIQFATGQKVNFNGTPTPQDVEEVANHLGINKSSDTQSNPSSQVPQQNLLQKIGDFIAPTTTKTIEKIGSGHLPSLRDVGGTALELGSFLIPGGELVKGAELGAKGLQAVLLANKAKNAAKVGAIAGGLSGAGRSVGTDGSSLGDIVSSTAEGAGFGALGGAALPFVPKVLGEAKNAVLPQKSAASAVEKILAKNAAGKIDTEAAKTLSSIEQKRLGTAGRIVQGTTEDAKLAANTLPKVDTTGVKTYADLSQRLGEHIDTKIKQVESEFSTNKKPVKLANLSQTVKSGLGNKTLTGKVNYVKNALGELKNQYKATKDIKGQLRIQGLINKAKNTGLTGGEINDIAKEHGSVLNGFNANGELASGLKKQAAENTRSGLKDTARSFLKNDAAKKADKDASDLIKTKKLTDAMAEKVNKLSQRVEKRNVVQKIGRGLGQAADIATFGGPKAFVTKLLFPSGVGEKQLTSLDIEAVLQKNLKLLNKIEKSPDSAVPSLLQGLIKKAGFKK